MWTIKDIGNQTGKTVIVTGANSGIGFDTASALYKAGATVVVTAREQGKADYAVYEMLETAGTGILEATVLDLSKPESIKEFADRFSKNHHSLDLLINNAGIMAPPASKTEMGYELQFAVNFLGHFSLTAYLYPMLKATTGARVVTVTSLAYLSGQIDFENIKMEKGYRANREYAQSKLADLLFTIELQRRIDRWGDNVLSVAAHPGLTDTNLSRHMTEEIYIATTERLGVLMPSAQGALSTLYAAVFGEVKKAGLYGPDGEDGLSGYPAYTATSTLANDIVLES